MNERKLMRRLLESNGSAANAQLLRGKKQSSKPAKLDMQEKKKKKKAPAKESGGNPNHDPSNGEFSSGDGSASGRPKTATYHLHGTPQGATAVTIAVSHSRDGYTSPDRFHMATKKWTIADAKNEMAALNKDGFKITRGHDISDTHSESFAIPGMNLIESLAERKPFHLIETNDGVKAKEGPRVTCVLITSGLGNRNQMNYYSVEAIQKGAALFEGKPCFLDHMAESESTERPERSVKEKCGYFKNVRPENIDDTIGLIGDLHFDLSETGQMAYQKALTAIHYKGEFPDSNQEYVGLSINANGLREKRTVQVGDEMLEVNYVTEFTDVGSIDEVTTPARGGRFLATLVESAAGALMKRKDTQTMIVKKLKAALTALTEASKDQKLSDELKEKLTEAQTPLESLLKEAMKCAEEESEEECTGGKESEESADGEGDGEEQPADASQGVKAGHTITKTVKVKHDVNAKPDDDGDDEDDDKDAQESKRGYIKSLLKEAGVPKKLWNIDRLMGLTLKEAKSDIAEKKALLESVREAIEEQDSVPVGNGGESFQESERDRSDMNASFAGLAD